MLKEIIKISMAWHYQDHNSLFLLIANNHKKDSPHLPPIEVG